MTSSLPTFTGFGLGLRSVHYNEFLNGDVPVDFVEIISENFMIDGGRPLSILDKVRQAHPMAMHGVSMSIGSGDGLNRAYLTRLKALADRIEPLWVSDHLCWTGVGGHNSHDLLPLPLTQEALSLVCEHVDQAQTCLKRPMLIENPSSYVQFAEDELTEWAFLSELCRRTACYLLLDVNNVFVSAHNHHFDTADYIKGLPLERVRQIHLAGHTSNETLLIDTHDQPVPDGVWDLYTKVMSRVSDVAVMIERDDHIPPLSDLLVELDQARALAGHRQESLVI